MRQHAELRRVHEVAMTLRPHQNVVVWSQSVGPADGYGALRFTRLTHTRRIRRFFRTAALLAVVGLKRLARTVRSPAGRPTRSTARLSASWPNTRPRPRGRSSGDL